MSRFLTRLFATRKPAAARPAPRSSLNVETLETREAPSGLSLTPATLHTIEKIHKLRILTGAQMASRGIIDGIFYQ
jgi:hypothetical protein